MKKVIIVQTPYQFIISLYLKHQFSLSEDQVDLIIADTFNNYDIVYKKIKEKNIFDNVYVVNIKNSLLPNISKFANIKKIYYILNPKKMIKKFLKNIDNYDEIYCSNYDIFLATIRSYYGLKKHYPKIFLCEEAYNSYFPIDEMYPIRRFLKIIELRNKVFGLSKINRNHIDGWLLFEPENLLYKPNCPVYKIDRRYGQTKEFKNIVEYIFNAREAVKKYDRKFIIFEEAALANLPQIDDEKVFNNIIKIVGKENVIIKLHPRTNKDRFTEKGIKTLGSDGIPFEAITSVGDFKDKVFITISSSAIINYKMLMGNKMRGYLLFKFLKPGLKQFDSKYDEFWEKIGTVTKDGGIYIPKTEEDFYKQLNKEMSSDSNEKDNNK